jgi:hypothetical protein
LSPEERLAYSKHISEIVLAIGIQIVPKLKDILTELASDVDAIQLVLVPEIFCIIKYLYQFEDCYEYIK